MNQLQLEEKYSRKSVRNHVMRDIDKDDGSNVFQTCMQVVDKYRYGNYYQSKMDRITQLFNEMSVEEVVIELFIAVLPTKQMTPIQSIATQLGNRLGTLKLLDGIKTAGEVIAICESSGLYTLYHAQASGNDTGTLALNPNFIVNDDTRQLIEQHMYLPPMISKPKAWKNNVSGGNLMGSGSVILGAINHHNDTQDLQSLNILQNIAWSLNTYMLKKEETPNKQLDTQEKLAQFNELKKSSRKVYDLMLSLGNKFYFVWKHDKRGRTYSQGYHINLQSTEYKKAILQFNRKEKVTI